MFMYICWNHVYFYYLQCKKLNQTNVRLLISIYLYICINLNKLLRKIYKNVLILKLKIYENVNFYFVFFNKNSLFDIFLHKTNKNKKEREKQLLCCYFFCLIGCFFLCVFLTAHLHIFKQETKWQNPINYFDLHSFEVWMAVRVKTNFVPWMSPSRLYSFEHRPHCAPRRS